MKPAQLTRCLAVLAITTFGFMAQESSATMAAVHQQSAPAVHKVIFQVSDNNPKKWNLTLNNARNVMHALGAKHSKIEIVVYGPGIHMLKLESPVADRIAQASHAGIKIVACQNTMKALKLTKADMLGSIGYVPGGVLELMKKEGEGYAYIRP